MMARLSYAAAAVALTLGIEALVQQREHTGTGQPHTGESSRGGSGEGGRGVPSTPPSAEALSSGHEVKDMSARAVSYVLLTIVAVMAVVIGASVGMVWRFDIARRQSSARLTPQQTAASAPPGPHLQIHPYEDLAKLRVREERELHGYAWVSADKSAAHIPIERAMALMVGKSLDPVP
jgi:hypothetical protein